MISLRTSLARYFHCIGVACGMVDVKYDANLNSAADDGVLRIYSRVFTLLLFAFAPINLFNLVEYLCETDAIHKLLKIVWSIECITLFFVVYAVYMTVAFNRETIRKHIRDGLRMFGDSDEQRVPYLRAFIFKLAVLDTTILVAELVLTYQFVFITFWARFYVTFYILFNFLSFFMFNVFIFVLSLMHAECASINASMRCAVQMENHRGFEECVAAHKRLLVFARDVVDTIAKACLTNFLYAFTTTLSSVRP
jgi:hypothetical protein